MTQDRKDKTINIRVVVEKIETLTQEMESCQNKINDIMKVREQLLIDIMLNKAKIEVLQEITE